MKPSISHPSVFTVVLDRLLQHVQPRSAVIEATSHWIKHADILLWTPLREFLYRHGLTRAARQLIVFRLPVLMRVPIVRRALPGGM